MTHWKRTFFLFASTQALSSLGTSVVQYALTWYLTIQTRSGMVMAGALVANFLPNMFFSPWGGVLADRANRKTVIVASDALAASGALLLSLVALRGGLSVPLMYAVMFFRSAANAVQRPSTAALVPSFVPQHELIRANGWDSSLNALSQLLAPALGGVVLGVWPLWAVMLVDVATALLAIGVFYFFVDIPLYGTHSTDQRELSWSANLKNGWAHIRRNRVIVHLMIYAGLFNFISGGPVILSDLLVVRLHGAGPEMLSVVSTVFSLGVILGGLLIAKIKGFKRVMLTATLCGLVIAAATLALALSPVVWGVALAMFVMGAAASCLNSPVYSLLVVQSGQEHLGKVVAFFSMTMSVVMPLSGLIFGTLADAVPLRPLYSVLALIAVPVGLIGIFDPALNRCELPEEDPSTPEEN